MQLLYCMRSLSSRLCMGKKKLNPGLDTDKVKLKFKETSLIEQTCTVELSVLLEEISCRRELNSRDSSSAVAKDAFRSSDMDWTTGESNTYSQSHVAMSKCHCTETCMIS